MHGLYYHRWLYEYCTNLVAVCECLSNSCQLALANPVCASRANFASSPWRVYTNPRYPWQTLALLKTSFLKLNEFPFFETKYTSYSSLCWMNSSKDLSLTGFRIPHWFNADPDPACFIIAEPNTVPVPDPGVWWPKIGKNLQLKIFCSFFDQKLPFTGTYP